VIEFLKMGRGKKFIPYLWLGLTLLKVQEESSEPRHTSESQKISEVSFLIHPGCWDLVLGENGKIDSGYRYQVFAYRGGARYDEKEFYEILEWERAVNQKQKEYIKQMKSDEVLVIYRIGDRPAMRSLEGVGQQALGTRCIIIHSDTF
jgi:hypothetical protein